MKNVHALEILLSIVLMWWCPHVHAREDTDEHMDHGRVTVITKDTPLPTQAIPVESLAYVSAQTYILNVQDAMELALKNHEPLQFAEKQLEIAKWKVLEAWRNFLPTVSLSYNESHGQSTTTRYEGASKELSVSQTIYAGGRILNSYKQARLSIQLAENNYEQLRRTLTSDVKEAFYNMALHEVNVDIQQDVFAETQRIYAIEKKLLSMEINTHLDYLNAVSGYNTIKFAKISARKDLDLAAITLRNVLSVPPQSKIHIFYDLEFREVDASLEECVELAVTHRPDLEASKLNADIAAYARDIVEAKEKPTVSFDWTYQRKGESPTVNDHIDLQEGFTWALRADVPLWGGNTFRYAKQKSKTPNTFSEFSSGPKSYQDAYTLDLFNNLGYYSEKEGAVLEEMQKEYEHKSLQREVRREVAEEYYNLMGLNQQVENSLVKLDITSRELAITEVRRELGEILVKELLDAQIALSKEKFSYAQLLTRYYLQLDKLSNAVGVPEYFTY